MKIILLSSFLCFSLILSGQTIKELEDNLANTNNHKERVLIQLDLAEKLLHRDSEKAASYARKVFDATTKSNKNGLAAQSAFILANAYKKQRDDRNQEVWLKNTQQYAIKAKDSDLIIKSVNQRSKLATKNRNYRKAYEINQEAFDFFSKNGNSLSQLERTYDNQKAVLEKETRVMEDDKQALAREITRLINEKNRLAQDKTQLTKQQEALVQEKMEVDSLISLKEEALVGLSEAKLKAEQRAKRKEKEVKALKRAELEQMVVLESKEKELAMAALEQEKHQNYLKVAALIGLTMILLLLIFYFRYRTNKSANRKLAEKNRIIEEEEQRANELLLNILPADIAKELKENGKASAQKFSEASVLFSDFKNFTEISERLSPEQLVKELDYCFRGFDFIISQYSGVEKIKTIGDAYMCASGLSNRRSIPKGLVKAALEMQEFLEDYKRDRKKAGLPYFEARIGIHTGPVVAGVVGVKKFAYDIWGDTVNIAARLEANCQEGMVNISASTYGKIKYQFECDHRGKLRAKNKGMIDMYYVRREISAVPVYS